MEDCFADRDQGKHKATDLKIEDSLYFYGVVNDNKGMTVKDASVMVYACYDGGIEKPLGYTSTDRTGAYFISTPKPPDYKDLVRFKVRAGKSSLLTKFDYMVNRKEKLCKKTKQNFVQDMRSNDECVPGREEIPDFKMTLTDECNDVRKETDIITLSNRIDLDLSKEVTLKEVTLIEYNRLPDGEMTFESASRKNGLTPVSTLLIILGLFCIFQWQKV